MESQELERQIAELVKEDPKGMVQVLQNWLAGPNFMEYVQKSAAKKRG
jgi:hypothetical protein